MNKTVLLQKLINLPRKKIRSTQQWRQHRLRFPELQRLPWQSLIATKRVADACVMTSRRDAARPACSSRHHRDPSTRL